MNDFFLSAFLEENAGNFFGGSALNKGLLEATLTLARSMKDKGMEMADIEEITGLSAEEIQAL